MVNNKVDYCFMEVSSHGLVLDRVSYLNFYIGVFSNLSQDHLDFHKTMENYYQAKKKLYYMVDKFSIINTDDKYGNRLYNELKEDKVNVISFGMNEDCDYKIVINDLSLEKSDFTLVNKDKEYRFETYSIGKFNIYNITPAIIIALLEGFSYEEIKNAIKKYHGTNGRVEKIHKDIFIDYAHTPDAMENVLKLVKEVSSKKITLVFGCGGNRSAVRRSAMGRVSSELADLTIITQDNSRDEPFEQILADILLGVTGDYVVIRDRKEAIGYCMSQMRPGDLLVLVGKGHEDTQEIAGKVEAFSERDIVESIEKTKKGKVSK